jgi:hypothetical protein
MSHWLMLPLTSKTDTRSYSNVTRTSQYYYAGDKSPKSFPSLDVIQTVTLYHVLHPKE